MTRPSSGHHGSGDDNAKMARPSFGPSPPSSQGAGPLWRSSGAHLGLFLASRGLYASFARPDQHRDLPPRLPVRPPDLPLLASAPSPNRFDRLCWSRPGAIEGESFPLRLLTGGLSDGSIVVWNPLSMIRRQWQRLVHQAAAPSSSHLVPLLHPDVAHVGIPIVSSGDIPVIAMMAPLFHTRM